MGDKAKKDDQTDAKIYCYFCEKEKRASKNLKACCVQHAIKNTYDKIISSDLPRYSSKAIIKRD